ncbi:MAG: HlyD family efflux transporter periplasmic adaptor subunit [Vicinamibacterales bacterium]
MKQRRVIVVSAVVIVATLAVAAVVVARSSVSRLAADTSQPTVPTIRVERGSLELTVYMDGELRASRQQTIMAPTVGGALRFLTLLDTGVEVKAGDVIAEFDPADQQFALEQAESELLEADQEIVKRKADTDVQVAGDKVKRLTDQFNVRRAELDAQVTPDLVSGNDFKIRQASLDEARRTLAQTERDVASRVALNSAGLSVLQQKRARSNLSAERARQNIESLVIKAPMDGVVSVRENQDAAGGFFFFGMTLPAYRVGDTTTPGRAIVDIFDLSALEIRGSVNEQDRANISAGQKVTVKSNVAPSKPLTATVKSVSGLGRADRSAGPLRVFDVILVLDAAEKDLRPGTSVSLVAQGNKIDNVLVLPRQAVFEVDGKPVVYERTAEGFAARAIKVVQRTESRVAVDGVPQGTEVALVNPAAAASGTPKPAAPASGPRLAP